MRDFYDVLTDINNLTEPRPANALPQPDDFANLNLYTPDNSEQLYADPKTISGQIQEALGARQPNQNEAIRQILSQRFQPSLDDVATAAQQTYFGGGKPMSGQDVADSRFKSNLDQLESLGRYNYYLNKGVGGGGGSVFAQTMAAINEDPELSQLSPIQKIRLAQNKLGTNLTVGPDGNIIDMAGAAIGLGNLAYGEKSGGERGTQEVRQVYVPVTEGLSQQAKNAADVAAAGPTKEAQLKGQKSAEAQASLGSLATSTQKTINLINSIKTSPGFSAVIGVRNPLKGAIPFTRGDHAMRGTPAADTLAKIEELKGGGFLQAIQQMQGFGALSNQEGDKAGAAFARLQTAQSEQEYQAALDEMANLINQGYKNAEKIANGQFQPDVSPLEDPIDAELRRRGIQ